MTVDEVLVTTKNAMRIRHNSLNELLRSDIETGALELKRAGVSVFNEDGSYKDDALLEAALRFFAMASEDYNGKGQQYMQAFERIRDACALSGEYKDAQ